MQYIEHVPSHPEEDVLGDPFEYEQVRVNVMCISGLNINCRLSMQNDVGPVEDEENPLLDTVPSAQRKSRSYVHLLYSYVQIYINYVSK